MCLLWVGILLLIWSKFVNPIRSGPVRCDLIRSDLSFANGLFDILIVFGSLNVFHKSCWISFCVSDFCGYMYK